ncbi:rRNA maturation RNase YbeY [Pannonibacter phragmitetus]|uniref:rRNA maturation RNase YbeY n=1 Tax=Pannonibacter phragmitetus TaxID=121719 RepID=UPI0009E2A6AC|nr:rRNA maturation RNase YbeY [Pannonibacter phragmitetus]MBA4204822.1 rRNA maturation RNase YbeY [Polymorphum sp.]
MPPASAAASGLPEDFLLDLSIECDGWPEEDELEALSLRAAEAAFRIGGLKAMPGSELSLLFVDDARIRELNTEWRNKDKATNVLSFPGGEEMNGLYGPLLGDIVFALETVSKEAEEQAISFQDHFLHLVVHGLLHLFGYDHQMEAEAEEMEDLERRILASMGIADPYADAPLVADDPQEP